MILCCSPLIFNSLQNVMNRNSLVLVLSCLCCERVRSFRMVRRFFGF